MQHEQMIYPDDIKESIMNEEIEDNKFTWNDVVMIKNNAPEYLHPGEIGSVCGMEKVKFKDVAEEYHVKVGDWVYTIEFDDGNDITIPEVYLEKLDLPKK